MNMEDSNIREKLFMDLWNEMAAETDYNYPMSRGEYVEVLINGEYCGLYLLQRRIDEKYLQLTDAVLLKGNQDLVYEIVTNRYDADKGTAAFDAFFFENDCAHLHLKNFVDVSLFLQLFSSMDNKSYKNMYYVFEGTGEDQSIRLIPWDTDLAMGAVWGGYGIGFVYDFEESVYTVVNRREIEDMQALHPSLNREITNRWLQLRENLITEEHIYQLMDGYLEELDASGAVRRDQDKWGLFYNGEDTIENLYRFVSERIWALDMMCEYLSEQQ